MIRIIAAVLTFVCLIGVATVVETPAIPNITNCDAALIGLAIATYNLNQCTSGGVDPIYHCFSEMDAIATAQSNVTIFCGIEEMPY
jgi:hypothetical protein